MIKENFERFVKSNFGLEIYSKEKLIFRSRKESIQGLLKFIKKSKSFPKDLTPIRNKFLTGLTVFDKKVGNAVALLCVYLNAKEVFGVVGSKSAQKTFKKFKIKFHFLKTIPNILNKKGNDICPTEKMSFGKTPTAFLKLFERKSFSK